MVDTTAPAAPAAFPIFITKTVETPSHLVHITGVQADFMFIAVQKVARAWDGKFSVDSYGKLFAVTMDEAVAEITQKWTRRQ